MPSAFCKICRIFGTYFSEQEENRKKDVKKILSDVHIQVNQAALAAEGAL